MRRIKIFRQIEYWPPTFERASEEYRNEAIRKSMDVGTQADLWLAENPKVTAISITSHVEVSGGFHTTVKSHPVTGY